MKIYHNPKCAKSRETLALIREAGIEPEIIEYLKVPPGREELRNLLEMLGIKAEALIRKVENIYKTQFKGQKHGEEEWISILAAHPQLIERPIVVKGKKAVLGRPPENVKALL